eukprot:4891147-Prymnesium_polylepis.1
MDEVLKRRAKNHLKKMWERVGGRVQHACRARELERAFARTNEREGGRIFERVPQVLLSAGQGEGTASRVEEA